MADVIGLQGCHEDEALAEEKGSMGSCFVCHRSNHNTACLGW